MTYEEIESANIQDFCTRAGKDFGVPVTPDDCRRAIDGEAVKVDDKPLTYTRHDNICHLSLDLGGHRSVSQFWNA